jgi:ribulose 1,5-bisphosphate synthetase/thiazole synthase
MQETAVLGENRLMAKQVREATKSLWMETAEVSRHQSLSTDLEADVCIVGAGIAGLTTAY